MVPSLAGKKHHVEDYNQAVHLEHCNSTASQETEMREYNISLSLQQGICVLNKFLKENCISSQSNQRLVVFLLLKSVTLSSEAEVIKLFMFITAEQESFS